MRYQLGRLTRDERGKRGERLVVAGSPVFAFTKSLVASPAFDVAGVDGRGYWRETVSIWSSSSSVRFSASSSCGPLDLVFSDERKYIQLL